MSSALVSRFLTLDHQGSQERCFLISWNPLDASLTCVICLASRFPSMTEQTELSNSRGTMHIPPPRVVQYTNCSISTTQPGSPAKTYGLLRLYTHYIYIYNIYIYIFYIYIYIFFFFCPAQQVGSESPDQGLNPCPLQWKSRILTMGQPGKSV